MSINKLWISKYYTAGFRLYQQRCSALIWDIMQCPAININRIVIYYLAKIVNQRKVLFLNETLPNIGVFQTNHQDFLFFALSQDFGPIKNLLLKTKQSFSIEWVSSWLSTVKLQRSREIMHLLASAGHPFDCLCNNSHLCEIFEEISSHWDPSWGSHWPRPSPA